MNRGSEQQRSNSRLDSHSGSLHRMESDFIKEHDMSRGHRESELSQNLNPAYTPIQSNYRQKNSVGIENAEGRNAAMDAIPRTLETVLQRSSSLNQGRTSFKYLHHTGYQETTDQHSA